MLKVTTNEGIEIEAKGDTLYISNVPDAPEYKYGVFSLRRSHWKLEGQGFPDGVWKDIVDGKADYCLRDRGEGGHEVFISFLAEKKPYPEYTIIYIYKINIDADNNVTIGDKLQ